MNAVDMSVASIPDQPKLHTLLGLDALPTGIMFVTVKDKHTGLYHLPSQKSTFGPIPVPSLVSNSGCKDHLLALTPELLEDIFTHFPVATHAFRLSTTAGTVLEVKPWLRVPFAFSVRLGVDQFTDATVQLPCLRFLLSSSDAAAIARDEDKLNRFVIPKHRAWLQKHAKGTARGLQVSHLGNDILDQFSEIRVYDVSFFVHYSLLQAEAFAQLPLWDRMIAGSLRDPDECDY